MVINFIKYLFGDILILGYFPSLSRYSFWAHHGRHLRHLIAQFRGLWLALCRVSLFDQSYNTVLVRSDSSASEGECRPNQRKLSATVGLPVVLVITGVLMSADKDMPCMKVMRYLARDDSLISFIIFPFPH